MPSPFIKFEALSAAAEPMSQLLESPLWIFNVLSICLVCLRLFALTVKYTLHPLSVEDVIEQCQTKIDRLGGHYFLTIEPNGCKSHAICMLALLWPYSYVHINALSKEDALRWKEETSPYCSVLYRLYQWNAEAFDAGGCRRYEQGATPCSCARATRGCILFWTSTTGYPDHCGSGVGVRWGCSPIMQFLTHQLPPDPTAYVSSWPGENLENRLHIIHILSEADRKFSEEWPGGAPEVRKTGGEPPKT